MKRCAIIGKTNVGKTLFLINFAEYLGVKSFNIEFVNNTGSKTSEKIIPQTAVSYLVDKNPHKTRCLQSIIINVPVGKGKKKIKIVDTSGFIDGIHPNIEIRKAISQTLTTVRDSDIILHIIDASAVKNKDLPSSMGEVDYQIAQFAQLKKSYAILANKMDLPGANEGFEKIKQEFSGNLIFPISALHKTGFKEVKIFVMHNI
ncbi:GTP-binding protein HSR1-related protein [Tepidanaerobacter acetatoxydans Re1]|uniref:GTP-binding protein HSR1-related protein n=1 Tax=Tepidanaerobacter acetatoxydans (strain DSM 21804 / JCM 16047 / Re1) TaxID=1209989 RepID=F4LUE1_TEPAE|nr:GTPase [Tepidanaerobacter acetatoxydans]AEE91471.1 GTP-binding protein HSR1-related protein [Tepidanaerobacter acetatoxydans Re1]CDI40688.1 GTP-binding protein HSR1-related protein [Tepidanaerobacter acetatoxydans Re1]